MMSPRFTLLVTLGPDVGASIVVERDPRRIGRGKGNDLVLGDRTVSRRHLEAVADDGGVRLRCLSAAAPFVKKGTAMTEAVLAPGEVAVIGDTALAVVVDRRKEPAGEAETDVSVTDARGLFGSGLAAAIRGLGAVAKLVEALDEVITSTPGDDVRASLAHAVDRWARTQVGVAGAALRDRREVGTGEAAERLATEPWLVVATPAKGGVIEIAAGTHGGSALVVRLRGGRADDDVLRLVAVAARVVSSALARIETTRALEQDVSSLRTLALGSARSFLGDSPAAVRVARMVPKLAASDATVLVTGESGTGKTFLARIIHEGSARAKHALRVINCAAIPENLLESELFGHERGAFTGALSPRAGAFEAVGRGTLLLDEIGELPPTSQAKLLRALEERTFERVGSNRALPLEARVLAATNRDLPAMVEAGTFRSDLYYRLSVVTMHVPPLRERGDDVVELAKYLLADLAGVAGRRVRGFSKGAIAELKARTWPGNVRELRNAIEHALVLGESALIEASDLPPVVTSRSAPTKGRSITLPAKLSWLEERAIEAALATSDGNQKEAAALLGINRVTLYKKLQRKKSGR